MIIQKKPLKNDLSFFVGITTILLVTGLLFIYSASSVFALEKYGSAHMYLKKQLIGLMLGLVAAFIIQWIPLSYIKKSTPYLFFASLGLTALPLITALGKNIHGSSRWVKLFISFQPSELLKIFFILYLAYFLTKKSKNNFSPLYNYFQLLAVIGLISIILLKQPDFGLMVTFIITTSIVLLIIKRHLKYGAITILAGIPLLFVLVIAKAYRLQRVLIFLNPWADPQGAGFQIIQSLIAIGSGGFFGTGIGHSKQKFFYLPMQHTDFIFSIIAEEAGFFGTTAIIFLFLLFLYFGLRIVWQLHQQFSQLATLGFVTIISLQALINICVTTGLAPTKGIGLPFISYGNTALVCQIIMIGIIISFVNKDEI